MLDKKEVQKAGYQVRDTATLLPDDRQQKLEQIQAILPDLVNDGVLDVAALKDLLGVENFAPTNQGYSLNFAGKGLAKVKASEPTKKELKIETGQSKHFDTTENVIIRGDNLDVLKILRQNYYGKVKMIYIDPPYNTENGNFIYNDDFSVSEAELIEKYGIDEEAINFFDNMFGSLTHSGWLFAMYPRLKLARDLLTDDGVIFISIDDNEQANLKIMCDEIFGESNFISQIVWQKKTGSSDTSTIATVTEYILVYSKSSNTESLFSKNEGSYDINRYNLTDAFHEKRGNYYIDNLDRGGLEYSDSLNFPITCPDGSKTYPNGRKNYINEGWIWKWSRKKVKWGLENDFIEFRRSKKKESGWSVCYKNYLLVDNEDNPIKRSSPNKNIMMIDDVLNTDAASNMKELFTSNIFPYSKPVELLKKVIFYVNFTNGIILDFFSGSGTTAQAVMDLNKEDGGNRKFILVQWDEAIDSKKNKLAYDFCKKNNFEPIISSICIERVNRAGEKIKQEAGLSGESLDIGYRVFSLTDRPELVENGAQIELNITRATTQDTLYNMVAASGRPLHSHIEEMEEGLLYKVAKQGENDDDAYYVLGACQTDLKPLSNIFIDGYADIKLDSWLNMLGLDKETTTILY